MAIQLNSVQQLNSTIGVQPLEMGNQLTNPEIHTMNFLGVNFAPGNEDIIQTVLELTEAIKHGEIKSLKVMKDAYQSVETLKIEYETNDNKKGTIDVLNTFQAEDIIELAAKNNIKVKVKNPNLANASKEYLKSLLVPLTVGLVGIFGTKFTVGNFAKHQLKKEIKKSILTPENITLGFKEFKLEEAQNEFTGARRLIGEAKSLDTIIKRFQNTQNREEFYKDLKGVYLVGPGGSGKTTFSKNLARAVHEADPNNSIAFEFSPTHPGFAQFTGMQEKAQAYVEASGDKDLIILIADDKKAEATGDLFKAIYDVALTKGKKVVLFAAGNEVHTSKSANEVVALRRRGVRVKRVKMIDEDIRTTLEKTLKDYGVYNKSLIHAFIEAVNKNEDLIDMEIKGNLTYSVLDEFAHDLSNSGINISELAKQISNKKGNLYEDFLEEMYSWTLTNKKERKRRFG
ncbi:MAG TPA: hypothetical protein V6C96_01580 [Vampirovibrionales bacterium]